jgi:hypothetical protein
LGGQLPEAPVAYASEKTHGLQGAARVVARPRCSKLKLSPDASRSAAIHREMRRQKVAADTLHVQLLRTKLRSLSYDKGGQNPAKLFQHWDANNSGTLDFGEFARAVRGGRASPRPPPMHRWWPGSGHVSGRSVPN